MNHANFAQGTLAAAITDTGGTSITVASSTGFPATPFIISIDTEAFLVGTVAGATWTVTRGYEGSTAATHLNGAAIFHDISAAEADSIVAKLDKAGGTLTGNLVVDNMDVSLVKLLTLNGEIDDSAGAATIDWNSGAAHKVTLGAPTTLAFVGTGTDIVPTMTGVNIPSGMVTESAEYSGYEAWKVFDNNTGTRWAPQATLPQWVQYQFSTAHTILSYGLWGLNRNTAQMTGGAWTVKGSNNGTDWTTIDSRSGISPTLAGADWYTIATPGSYTYYRITFTAGEAGINLLLYEWYLSEIAGISNPPSPCFLTLKLVQDGTGGRTVTWPATVKGTPNLNAAASSTSIVLLYWDGTNYYVVNPAGTLASLGLDADLVTLALPANTTISAAGAELINDTDAAAQLATLGTAAYSEGTWTPTLVSFTVVGTAPTVSGTYKRIGALVFVTITIAAGAGGNTSVACLGGVGGISNLPASVSGQSTCNAVGATAESLGIGSVTGPYILPAAFSAQATPIRITAIYNTA